MNKKKKTIATGKASNKNYYYPLHIHKINTIEKNQYLRLIKKSEQHSELSNILQLINKKYQLTLQTVKESNVDILSLLDNIIPYRYFGSPTNRKLFYKIVKKIMTASCHECIFKKTLASSFACKKMPWLKMQCLRMDNCCVQTVGPANMFILDTYVKPLIYHYYYPLKTRKGHQIRMITRPEWKCFEAKVLNKLLSEEFLVFDNYCQKLQDTVQKNMIPFQVRGALEIIPKEDVQNYNLFRPLIKYFHKKTAYHNRCRELSKQIYKIAKQLSFVKTGSLYRFWKNFVIKEKGKYIYGAKIDVSDAFGNVDTDVLCNIINNLEQLERRSKAFLTMHIRTQYIIYKRNSFGHPMVWQWKHGLLQGDPLSSALCELYMSFLDYNQLSKFNKEDFFIHRTVDDYFFCSPNKMDVNDCMNAITVIHKINPSKTQTNVFDPGESKIEYLGQIFDLDTLHVKGLYKFSSDVSPGNKFKFWNIKKPIPKRKLETFLKTSMKFAYNNFHFKKLELNLFFNDEETVMQNFFESMINTAVKFDAAVMSRYEGSLNADIVTAALTYVVKKYSRKSFDKLQACCGVEKSGKLNYQIFLRLAYRAFIILLKKRQIVYKDVLKQIDSNKKFIYVEGCPDIDFKYFTKLPLCFKNLRLKRTNSG